MDIVHPLGPRWYDHCVSEVLCALTNPQRESDRFILDGFCHKGSEGCSLLPWDEIYDVEISPLFWFWVSFFSEIRATNRHTHCWAVSVMICLQFLSMELLSRLVKMGNVLYTWGWATFWDFGENPRVEKQIERACSEMQATGMLLFSMLCQNQADTENGMEHA